MIKRLSKQDIKRIKKSTTYHFHRCTGTGCLKAVRNTVTGKVETLHTDQLCNKLFPKIKETNSCPCQIYGSGEIGEIVKKAVGKLSFFMRYYMI